MTQNQPQLAPKEAGDYADFQQQEPAEQQIQIDQFSGSNNLSARSEEFYPKDRK